MTELTDRQGAILDRLEKSMSAQEIADDLGVTRNAVYQQIQAIRRKGHLAKTYTPSGQASRAIDAPRQLRSLEGGPLVMQSFTLLDEIANELERLSTQIRAHTEGDGDR